jgi:hypothetical protein
MTTKIRDDNVRPHFNVEKKKKMVLTGESFYEVLFESLFKNITATKSAHVVISNLIPYDASLQKFVMRNNEKESSLRGLELPKFVVCSPIWANQSKDDKKKLMTYHQEELIRFAEELCTAGILKYDRLQAIPTVAPSLATVQVLLVEKFHLNKPMVDQGECLIKQEFFNKWLNVPAVAKEVAELTETWNKARCKSGTSWKGEQKRTSSGREPDDEDQAAPVPTSEGDARTLTEAQAKYGSPTIILSKNPIFEHVIFPTTGAYGWNIKEDGIIGVGEYLLLFKGSFESGEAAQKAHLTR